MENTPLNIPSVWGLIREATELGKDGATDKARMLLSPAGRSWIEEVEALC